MNDVPSYRKINYSLRPAKNIERKMIAEGCSRLMRIGLLQAYRYVGFGSPFFSDFRLFHRVLGFTDMVNIEIEEDDAERFEFNKPLGFIGMRYGQASDVLSDMRWQDVPTIIWLDYDKQLDVDKLQDIGYLAANLQSISLLIITVRSKSGDFGIRGEKITNFKNHFGSTIPPGFGQQHLAQSRFAGTLRTVINENIHAVLQDRNAALPENSRYDYRQIFNFTYDDGTPMLTLGGVLLQRFQSAQFESCEFDTLDFCRTGSSPYEILAPSLTYKEQRHIDSQLPNVSASSPGVPAVDVEAYSRVYKYFPTFVEAEL